MKDIKIYEKCGSNIGYDREGSKALNEYHDLYKGTDTFLKSISTSHWGKGKISLKVKPSCIIIAK